MAFPILGADFLINFRLLVDIIIKRLVACGDKLIKLKQGKRSKVAVVTGVVAAAPPLVVAPSSPSLHTVEALLYMYTFTSHSGGTQQRPLRAASSHKARRGSQETSSEIQGCRRSQQVAP